MKEVKPDSNPGTVSPEVAVAAQSGEVRRWGKGTSRPEEGMFVREGSTSAVQQEDLF
jgi:hypothetical protein